MSGFVWISKRVVPTARLLVVVIALAIAVGAAAGVSPHSALGGEYHVYSCKTPDGEVAPTEGWSGSTTGSDAFAEDTCGEPKGALIAALGAYKPRTANVDFATWAFTAPTNTSIAGGVLVRAGDVDGGWKLNGSYDAWFSGPAETDHFATCIAEQMCTEVGEIGSPMAPDNRLPLESGYSGTMLYEQALCGGEALFECPDVSGDPNGYAAVMYLYAADLILEQTAGPTASNVGGELASAQTVSGTSSLTFTAHDPGSGVYQAVFSVDGRVVQSTVLDEDGGSCRNVGETTDGLPAFLYLQPCPALVNANVGFDTTAISNGTHQLAVSVTDAAGNAVKVLERTITVENQPQPSGSLTRAGVSNGTHASAQATLTAGWKGAKGWHLGSGFGHAHTIVGQLTGPGGVPIEGAKLGVMVTPAYLGAKVAAMASPVTGRDGRFSVVLPPGVSSRALQLSYSPTLGGQVVATRTLTLSVRAGVSLSISPRTASVGRSIYFSGHLRGGPIPRGGAPLVLEARSPGGAWLEFDVVRSGAGGGYHASYTFKFPGPQEYQFRVLCEAEADYPFATGASRVVGVFER